MNIKELLKNKTILYSVIGGVALLFFIIIMLIIVSTSGKSSQVPGKPIEKIHAVILKQKAHLPAQKRQYF